LSGGNLEQRTVFWALDSVSDLEFAVRTGDWKLFIDREGNPRDLYNLATDPLEFFDVSEKNPDVVANLISRFEAQEYLPNGADNDE